MFRHNSINLCAEYRSGGLFSSESESVFLAKLQILDRFIIIGPFDSGEVYGFSFKYKLTSLCSMRLDSKLPRAYYLRGT